MAPRRARRNGSRARPRARINAELISDWTGGLLSAGESYAVPVSGVNGIFGRDRPFRLVAVHVDVAVSDNTSAVVQVDILGPQGDQSAPSQDKLAGTATSGPMIIPHGARRTFSVKANDPYFPAGLPPTTKIARIACISQGVGDKFEVRYILRLDCILKREEFLMVSPGALSRRPDPAADSEDGPASSTFVVVNNSGGQ